MRSVLLGFAAVICFSGCARFCGDEVSAQTYEVPKAWELKKFCGKDFWPLFTPGYWSCDTPEWKKQGESCKQSWPPPECYVESALIHDATKQIMNDRPRRYGEKCDTNYPKPLKVGDFFYREARASFYGNPKPDKPAFLEIQNARPVFRLREKYDLDLEDFAAWKASHTNFVGIRAMTEFDSDSTNYDSFMRKSTNEALKAEFIATYGVLSNRYDRLEFLRRAVKRSEALRFGEKSFWTMFSSCLSMGHQMADAGVMGLFYEATSQECGRWQVGGAFLRGASRQFSIPFGWYTANWCTGFTRDGVLYTGANSMPVNADASHRPFGGAGRSSFDRQCAYGYFIGASFLEPEYPIRIHYHQPTKDSPRVPSDFAKDFNDLYLLSKRLDRGVVYSPCAMLVPLSVKYTSHGSAWWGEHPFALNAVFFTLAPIFSEDQFQRDLRKRGLQSCLYNSEFGEFYDVLSPDSRQSSERFTSAIKAYKWAFLLEEYRNDELDMEALKSFVDGGGTLVVSADQVKHFPLEMIGVKFSDRKIASGKAIKAGGKFIDLVQPYDWWRADSCHGAKPWIKDDNGVAAIYVNTHGRGRVLTVASKMMLPRAYEERTEGISYYPLLREITSGRAEFAVIRHLLRTAQDETMPVKVTGDIQWGVNKTERGFLVWLINNKGVKKYSFEPEEFDASATAEVQIVCKPTREVRNVKVGPGKWTFVEMSAK
jgi:hypothetical protein